MSLSTRVDTTRSSSDQALASMNPIIIGLYGVSGAGKTYVMSQLGTSSMAATFTVFEGSKVVAELVDGGLESFHLLPMDAKIRLREQAIMRIRAQCETNKTHGVVSGHFMFWTQNGGGKPIMTNHDLKVYTHIVYLDVDPAIVAGRRKADLQRIRNELTVSQIGAWQTAEKDQLRALCYEHGILFALFGNRETVHEASMQTLLERFCIHSEQHNQSSVIAEVDRVLVSTPHGIDTILVIDADKTLAPVDTGNLFWKQSELRDLFKWGYSYAAFRQAAALYHNLDPSDYDARCHAVSTSIAVHGPFIRFLREVSLHNNVKVLVVTCGLRQIWAEVLSRAGLSSVAVIGGGRLGQDHIVTAQIKADIVSHLQEHHDLCVFAFGDSPLDLPMLAKADRAFVVVGPEPVRSKSMEKALNDALGQGLRAEQILLPDTVSARLTTDRLPVITLCDRDLMRCLSKTRVMHATDKAAAKLLMTPTRDATLSGPALRAAHHRVGYYLAIEFVSQIIGLESCPIQHVQGHLVEGHCLLSESKTVIIPLMRGGEPLAFGINEAFPAASFVHAKFPIDLKLDHLLDRSMVLLVDSVINSGKSVVEFVRRPAGPGSSSCGHHAQGVAR